MDLIGDISQVYINIKIYLLSIAFAIRLAIKAPAAAASIRSVGPMDGLSEAPPFAVVEASSTVSCLVAADVSGNFL